MRLYQPCLHRTKMMKAKGQIGFTLIEITLVIMLLGLISVAVMRFYSSSLIATQTMQNTGDALSQARLALERMVIDIRAIRSTSDITTKTATNLVFTDINNNTFNYNLSGTNLLCNSQVLASGVNSLTFAYYDSTGTVTATLSSIRYIKITINVTKNNTDFTLTTSVYLREMNT